MIYLFDRPETVESLEPLLPFLPDFRRERALSYRFLKDRRQSALAYLLLRYALLEQGITDPGPFDFYEQGKPRLSRHQHIHFNLSHCDLGVCCIVAEQEVGIDIEVVSRYDAAVAKRVCNAEELLLIEQSEQPDKAFCRVWTQKESYLKLKGWGIGVNLRHLQPEGDFFFYEGDGFVLCAAGQIAPGITKINEWEMLCRSVP